MEISCSRKVTMSYEQNSDRVVHISNLPAGITSDFIKLLLQECGEVVNVVLKERPKGGNYAFVTFEDAQAALKCIREFNYTKLNGTPMVITPTTQEYQNLIKSGEGNLYVRGLDVYIEVSQLHELFQTYGEVISCKMPTNADGTNKGFAYVQFRNPADADKAKQELNDAVINGKKITVEPYKAKPAPSRADKSSSKAPTPTDDIFTNIFIRNLPNSIKNETDLRNLFSEFGVVISTKMLPDGTSGFCNMIDHDSAVRAIQALNGKVIEGKILEVVRAIPKDERLNQTARPPSKTSYVAPVNSFSGYSQSSQSVFSSPSSSTFTNPSNQSFGSTSTTTFGGSYSYNNKSSFSSPSAVFTPPQASTPFGSGYSQYSGSSYVQTPNMPPSFGQSPSSQSSAPMAGGSAFGQPQSKPTYNASQFTSPQSVYGTPGGSSTYTQPQNVPYGAPAQPSMYGSTAYGVPKGYDANYGGIKPFGSSAPQQPYGQTVYGQPQQNYTAFGAVPNSPSQTKYGQPNYGQMPYGGPPKGQGF